MVTMTPRLVGILWLASNPMVMMVEEEKRKSRVQPLREREYMVWSSIWGRIEFAKRIIGRNCQEMTALQCNCAAFQEPFNAISSRGRLRHSNTYHMVHTWYQKIFLHFWTNLPLGRGRVWSLCEHDGVALWGVSMLVKGNQSIGHSLVAHRTVALLLYRTSTGKVIQV